MINLCKLILLPMLFIGVLYGEEKVIKDSEGMACHVYLPDDFDAGKTYQLVVGVHGYRGNGKRAGGLARWAQRGDVIVIGPSFRSKGDRPYQNGDGVHSKKLITLFNELKKTYKLREKMFIHGYSGGSQFAHRFAMFHPKYVCGVSAHSGGSWATNGYGKINRKAKKIPFAISCGEKDTSRSFKGAILGRLDWFKRFRNEMVKGKFCHIGIVIPGAGHRPSGQVDNLMRQCFQLATGLPGGGVDKRVEISAEWKNLGDLAKEARKGNSGSVKKDLKGGRAVVPAQLDKVARKAFKIADEGVVPDAKLITFMKKYPPVLWKDKDGAKNLLMQCEEAAKRWRAMAIKKKRFRGAVLKQFENFSKGLILL